MELGVDLGRVGGLVPFVGFFVGWSINGLTLMRPSRPSWVGWAGSAALGVMFMYLAVLAIAEPTQRWDVVQIHAQTILGGFLSAAGAAGYSVTQASAESKREPYRTTQPDPVTPQSTPERPTDREVL